VILFAQRNTAGAGAAQFEMSFAGYLIDVP
jgi:hypothetical protein